MESAWSQHGVSLESAWSQHGVSAASSQCDVSTYCVLPMSMNVLSMNVCCVSRRRGSLVVTVTGCHSVWLSQCLVVTLHQQLSGSVCRHKAFFVDSAPVHAHIIPSGVLSKRVATVFFVDRSFPSDGVRSFQGMCVLRLPSLQ